MLANIYNQEIFSHRAANDQVTVYYSLYARKHLGWSEKQAKEFRRPVWQGSDYPVWQQSIREVEAQIGLVEDNK